MGQTLQVIPVCLILHLSIRSFAYANSSVQEAHSVLLPSFFLQYKRIIVSIIFFSFANEYFFIDFLYLAKLGEQ